MRKTHSISMAAAILIALTVIGSIWDFQIAQTIYLQDSLWGNLLGIIFSYIGIIPTFVGWSFLGASIFYLSGKQVENAGKRQRLKAFAILLFVLSFFYYCNTLYFSNANAFHVPLAAAYGIGSAVIAAAAYLGCWLSKKSEDPELLNKVLFLAGVSLLTMLMVSLTKEVMCRPRFRWVLAMDNADYFRNWWQNGRALKASLAADTVTDEFASFPSGHSAYAMFAIFLFPSLADYMSKLGRYRAQLFALGFVWWALTALSRLTMGAHYLTDVSIAALVAILSYGIVSAMKAIRSKRS